MDRSDIIDLINQTMAKNEYGVWSPEETKRTVFVKVDSVTASEFFDGGRNGLNPEYRFTMFGGDYQGEKVVEYNGERFAVYRTYKAKNDMIELYVERKGGTNGKESTS